MEQKDYLMREIEKIGLVLRAIVGGLFGLKENLSITAEAPFEKTKGQLLNEIDFDLDAFLVLDANASRSYLAQFKGMNVANLELLADITFQLATTESQSKKTLLFQKTLLLLNMCNEMDKTFSSAREKRIAEIKTSL